MLSGLQLLSVTRQLLYSKPLRNFALVDALKTTLLQKWRIELKVTQRGQKLTPVVLMLLCLKHLVLLAQIPSTVYHLSKIGMVTPASGQGGSTQNILLPGCFAFFHSGKLTEILRKYFEFTKLFLKGQEEWKRSTGVPRALLSGNGF